MKKTLQNLILTFSMALMAGVAVAQRQIPLEISVVAPINNAQLEYFTNYYYIINIENTSTTENLLEGDTVYFNFTGEPTILDPESFYSFAIPTGTGGIPAGESLALPILQGPNDNTTGANIVKDYCIIVLGPADAGIVGGTWSNSNPNAVDPTCVTFTLLPQSVGMNENNGHASFLAYPNPANESLSFMTSGLAEDALITVHNSLGQRVYETNAGTFRSSGAIQTADWKSGIYMITVTQNGVSTTQRVMIQH